jgi:molecular chaperone GrpE
MNNDSKEDLVEQFRAYIDESQHEFQRHLEPALALGEYDEASLVAELAGLKSEVKRESRQIKEALDQFKPVLGTLQAGYEILTREFEQRQQDEKDKRRELLRHLFLQLLELHDRLEAGVKLELKPRRSLLSRWRRNDELIELVDSLREGQKITLRRLNQLLSEYHLRPLEALSKPLDPHTMRVVEVELRTDLAQGTVTGEVRKGFFWGEELLRPAEVKVARQDEAKLGESE